MRVFLIAAACLAMVGPAMAQQQASDDPSWIPGQSRSTLTIYTLAGLQGDATVFTRDSGNITSGERAQSLRTRGGAWEVCDGANFRGECRVADGWTMRMSDLGLRRIRSIRPVETDLPTR